jgi:hypothetical protein
VRRDENAIIRTDLKKKMVFLVGPRQVGKTWLAKSFLTPASIYLNYDSVEDRKIIEATMWFPEADLVVLDELHKMPGWKNFLKGIYDTKAPAQSILVTGSARLDTFRGMGDSLTGRYFAHRLLPFTPNELTGDIYENDIDRLMSRGGFPEPFLAETSEGADRWRMQYFDGLIREDVFSIDSVSNLRSLALVLRLLQERVGSPVSYSAIARDTDLSPNTVKKYIGLFEALFVIFRVPPFSKNIARSIQKEPKLYFFDTGMVANDPGKRLENLVALSLYKHCLNTQDRQGKLRELFYLRTKEGREVDFLVADDESPAYMLEVKQSDTQIPVAMRYYEERYGMKGILLLQNLRNEFFDGNIEVRQVASWLKAL